MGSAYRVLLIVFLLIVISSLIIFKPGLFGIIQYGVHLNGYFKDDKGDVYMWVGRRSMKKQTYPGMLDQIVSIY